MVNSVEPVAIFRQSSEEKLLSSSPTSTADLHLAMDVCCNLNETSGVDRLVTAPVCENVSSSSSVGSSFKKNKSVIRLLHGSDIKILKPFQLVLDLKYELCRNSMIDKNDIMIIRDGMELSNSTALNQNDLVKSKVFVLTKTTSKTSIPISLKVLGDGSAKTKTLKIPMNMKVKALKKQLFSGKITTFKPECQRIIIGGKLLNDSYIIGDYFLTSLLGKSAPTTTKTDAVNGSQVTPVTTVYLSKTTNVEHEVSIQMTSANGFPLICDLPLNKPLSHINTILANKYRVPLPDETFSYIFTLKVPFKDAHDMKSPFFAAEKLASSTTPAATTSLSSQKKAKKSDSSSSDSEKESFVSIELDQTKTLLDYGYTSETKTLTFNILRDESRNKNQLPIVMPPVDPKFAFVMLTYMLMAADQRVRRMKEGLTAEQAAAEPVQMLPLSLPSSASAQQSLSLPSSASNSEVTQPDSAVVPARVANRPGEVTLTLTPQQLAQLLASRKLAQQGRKPLPVMATPNVPALLASAAAATTTSRGANSGGFMSFDEFSQLQAVMAASSGASKKPFVPAAPSSTPAVKASNTAVTSNVNAKKRPASSVTPAVTEASKPSAAVTVDSTASDVPKKVASSAKGGLFGGLKKGFLGGKK